VRAADGTITTFDPHGSKGTSGDAINKQGVIAGSYQDSGGTSHGFVRAVDGTITAFDPPGSEGTGAFGISGSKITGYYFDGSTDHGFLRSGH